MVMYVMSTFDLAFSSMVLALMVRCMLEALMYVMSTFDLAFS